MITRFECYQDAAGEWRWRAVAAENGQVLGDSGQGYVDLDDCLKGMERILMAARVGADIVIVDGTHDYTAIAEGVHDHLDDEPQVQP